MILKGDFRRKLCEEKGESKNIRAINRPEIGVNLRLNWFHLAIENSNFWCVDRLMR